MLEDDYDSEFRYVGRPLAALKSLDRGRTGSLRGSLSKVLFPALRLGYLVVPDELSDAFLRGARLLTAGPPALEQRGGCRRSSSKATSRATCAGCAACTPRGAVR